MTHWKMILLFIMLAANFIVLVTANRSAEVNKCEEPLIFNNRTIKCVNITEDDLPKLMKPTVESLWIENSSLPIIKKNHVEYYPQLKYFTAVKNDVETIEKDAFLSLSHLDKVDVSDNKLTAIDADLFHGCPEIYIFDVSYNPKILIPKDVPFLNAPQLQRLLLRRSNIDTLYSETFKNLTGLKNLVLSENKLTNLPPDIFEPLKNLSILYLSSNKLTRIDPNILQSCTKISTFSISGNTGIIIPENQAFLNAPKLRYLHMENSGIKKISSTAFRNVTGLYMLHLQGNELTSIPNHICDSLTELLGLNLSNNKITTVDPNVMEKCKSLWMFSIGGNINLIIHQNEPFLIKPKLAEVYLHNSKIKSLHPATFRNLTNLNSLYLQGNELANIPKEIFEPLTKLSNLDVSNNKLIKIDPDIFEFCKETILTLRIGGNRGIFIPNNQPFLIAPNLKRLNLEESNITTLYSVTFRNLSDLYYLSLSGNELANLSDDVFQSLPKLEKLDISNNKLTTIDPDIFKNCYKIQNFNISRNPNLIIPKNRIFLNAPNLKKLHLEESNIKALYSTNFRNLSGLLQLSLPRNELTHLPNNVFESLAKLEKLDLSSNKLKSLPMNIFDNMPSGGYLLLTDNPWECKCSLWEIIVKPDKLYYDNVKCSMPDTKELIDIRNLHCRDSNHHNITIKNR